MAKARSVPFSRWRIEMGNISGFVQPKLSGPVRLLKIQCSQYRRYWTGVVALATNTGTAQPIFSLISLVKCIVMPYFIYRGPPMTWIKWYGIRIVLWSKWWMPFRHVSLYTIHEYNRLDIHTLTCVSRCTWCTLYSAISDRIITRAGR